MREISSPERQQQVENQLDLSNERLDKSLKLNSEFTGVIIGGQERSPTALLKSSNNQDDYKLELLE